ncbi:MAG: chemotaxis response regulator protein-glutamate methylesterase [Deltaproteobacteria bacterium]|nr:chemotaxis response regulator protein-glutamate methylesterase [Deltaproteobacteria bacterium]
MPKIRVLVVDDAVVIRKILTEVLSSDEEIEVVGTAANGKIALQKIPQTNPDIVTLDVEMPELSGLDTIPLIRKDYPRLPIIMFSTLTERGGAATLEALSRGATDYVTKPANVGSVTNAKEAVRDELIGKIKSLAERRAFRPPPSASPAKIQPPVIKRPAISASPAVKIVVIGVSTGGPNALAKVIPALPGDFPAPILIVQHMPPMFTRLLADRLNDQAALTVVEATQSTKIEPGKVYIAPGDYHMEITGVLSDPRTKLHQGPPENSCRPAVDVLFRSAAALYGSAILAVVLTGMGQDGLLGSRYISEAGGRIIVQDQATSVVWGMPGYVAEAGLAEAVLPLESVAGEIIRRATGNFRPKCAAPGREGLA